MALSRISSVPDLLTTVTRISHTVNSFLSEMQCTRYVTVHQSRTKGLHVTSVRRYPDPPVLPLPTNVSEIFANETGRFTPERARDIAAPVLLYSKSNFKSFSSDGVTMLPERSSIPMTCEDTHVDSYDCFGAVSLNGTMQSNVPKPFCSSGKSMHLNMPGGQWARDGKYIAEDMQKSHYRSTRLPRLKLDKSEHIEKVFVTDEVNSVEIVICRSGPASQVITTTTLLQTAYQPNYIFTMAYSTNTPQHLKNTVNTNDEEKKIAELTKKERFRRVLRDYGKTVAVFHVGISLLSLGACYTVVISGVDLTPVIKSAILDDGSDRLEKLITNSSNFIIAYTIHKLLAPIRISITLLVTPPLVRYLRRIKVLKPPKVKTTNID